jgi:uncharacterized protein (TIGR02145 family)
MEHIYKLTTCTVFVIAFSLLGGTAVNAQDTVTDIDGNVYNTVTIGDQVWTTTHMRAERFSNGDSIPYVEFPADWVDRTTPGRVDFANNTAFGESFGYLYNWHTASDSRNICPAEMRVPTDDDWQALEAQAGMPAGEIGRAHNTWGGDNSTDNPGGKLKSTITRPDNNPAWRDPNTGATDEFGFNWLPGGTRFAGGAFPDDNARFAYGQIWTSGEVGEDGIRYLARFDRNGIRRQIVPKTNGSYIRCVADATATSNESINETPSTVTLAQNYPNPFNPSTVISYSLADAGNVKITVYDLVGRELSVLVNESKAAGTYQVSFDASALSSGIYMYRLQSEGQTLTRMMTLMK